MMTNVCNGTTYGEFFFSYPRACRLRTEYGHAWFLWVMILGHPFWISCGGESSEHGASGGFD